MSKLCGGCASSMRDKGRAYVHSHMEQFRFAVSTRSVAFMAAAMLGRPGLRMWQSAGSVAGRSAN